MDNPGPDNASLKPFSMGFLIAVYFLCLLFVAVYAYRRPHYNWDMLAYMALASRDDESSVSRIHQIAYQEAKENIPAGDYELLVSGEYKKNLAENPMAFYKVLPFYAVKPLYISAISFFHHLGFSLPASTVLPSAIFYLFIGLLIFYWLLKYLQLAWAFGASLLIMLTGFMVSLARLSAPDAMSAFFLLAAIYFILEKPSLAWMSVFLGWSLFTRLDNIIPIFFILSFLFFIRKGQTALKLTYYLLLLAVFAACYFGIVAVTMKPFGWGLLYYPNFAQYMNLSHVQTTGFSLHSYLSLLLDGAKRSLEFYHPAIFLFFFLLIFYSPQFKFKRLENDQLFILLLLLIIIFRFLLYPDLSDRFNAAYYLVFLVVLLKRYAQRTAVND
jgi:hypothetical protein